MTKSTRIPSELLWSYVEGRLEKRTAQAIDRYLAEHPEIRREVRVMQRQQELLDMIDASVLDEPVPERLSRVVECARRRLLKQGGNDGESGPGGGT